VDGYTQPMLRRRDFAVPPAYVEEVDADLTGGVTVPSGLPGQVAAELVVRTLVRLRLVRLGDGQLAVPHAVAEDGRTRPGQRRPARCLQPAQVDRRDRPDGEGEGEQRPERIGSPRHRRLA